MPNCAGCGLLPPSQKAKKQAQPGKSTYESARRPPAVLLAVSNKVPPHWLGDSLTLHFSTRSENVDRLFRTLLRSAGFGGASVPLAIPAYPSRRKIAGETPAPPTRAPRARHGGSEVHATPVARTPGQSTTRAAVLSR